MIGRIVAFLVVLLAAAGGGFAVGRAARLDAAGRPAPARDVPASAALDLAAELAELPLPRADLLGFLAWRPVVQEIELAFARHGLVLDASRENVTRARLADQRQPLALAGLLDGAAEAAHFADLPEMRGLCTRLARALDPDPLRDRLRALRLEGSAEEIRELAADHDPEDLDALTGLLLGATLLHCGERDEAIAIWRGASLADPSAVALHRILAWQLASGGFDERREARRHLEAWRALRPASEQAKLEQETLE